MKNNYVKTSSTRGGVGCLPIIGIVFIVLKLTHNIDWSWWWIMSPFIIHVALILVILAVFGGAVIYKARQLP